MGIANISQAQFWLPKEIYLNPKLSTFRKTHQTIAILPVNVKFVYNTQQFNFDPEAEHMAEINSSIILQSNLYSYLLPKSNKMSIDIQDIETTNVLLRRAEISDRVTEFTKAELAKILGVDAVISALFETERPLPEVPLHRFTSKPSKDSAKPGNPLQDQPMYSGALTLNLNDGGTGTLLWRYYKKTIGANSSDISDDLISKIVKDFPYNK